MTQVKEVDFGHEVENSIFDSPSCRSFFPNLL